MFQSSIEDATDSWFNDSQEFSRKRKHIAEIIEDLSRDKLMASSQLLPTLRFDAPVTRSKVRTPVYRDQSTDEEDIVTTNDDGEFSVAAAGFYGERSGLRSGRSRTNIILENADKERQKGLEKRKQRAKDKVKFLDKINICDKCSIN